MPEEKKKENFTFSDKIKDSKTAASKSFANRVSSRIGRDGKPKLTILERTKRDAPFLIAALVALLLLPFLYKYSGSVKEESVVTPSSAESVFDPERYAFAPDVENPDGEIAQLSARDPLDLIKGWGKEEEYEGSDDDLIDTDIEAARYKDAYSQASAASAKKSAKDTNVDIEENTTNIYKKRAVAGARHSFKRAATKINPIGTGRKASTSGHGLGVTNWGGAVKKATQKVNTPSPKDSPKPVSLQPLQAAGKPARVNFGDAAAAMRQAKDALGKRDAEKAILDAQVKPMDPGSFGGMTLGDTKFGGGSGKIDRKFNYQPQTPWWWDEMKTRSHYAWQKKFDWKWGIYDWMTKLAEKFLDKFLGCLLTGSEDWKMEHFLGTAAGSGSKAKCCGKEEDRVKIAFPNEYNAASGNFKEACKAIQWKITSAGGKCDEGFEEAKPAPRALNFFQTRGACLGASFGYDPKSQPPGLKTRWPCSALSKTHVYSLKPEGKAQTWNRYHYVVVRNYVPLLLENGIRNVDAAGKDEHQQRVLGKADSIMTLCSTHDNSLRWNGVTSAGLSAMYNLSDEDRAALMAIESAIGAKERNYRTEPQDEKARTDRSEDYDEIYRSKDNQSDKYNAMLSYARAHKNSKYKDNDDAFFATEQIDSESLLDACVIYVAEGDKLEWEKGFQPQVTTLLQKIIEERHIPFPPGISSRELAVRMFNQLDLLLIEGMASNKTISHKKNFVELLPMRYEEFIAAYIDHYGTTGKADDTGKRAGVYNDRFRNEGHDTVTGARCYFNNSVKISCEDNTYPVKATVTFNGESFMGGRAGVVSDQPLDPAKKDKNFTAEKAKITVKAAFVPYKGELEKENFQKVDPEPESRGASVEYVFDDVKYFANEENKRILDGMAVQYKRDHEDTGFFLGIPGRVKWQLFRGGEMIGEASCEVDNQGNNVPPVPQAPTPEPTKKRDENPEPKLEPKNPPGGTPELHYNKDCEEFNYKNELLEKPKGAALAYMKEVYPNRDTFTVGDVAEAVYLKQGRVPANLVCVMGKTIGNLSRDITAPQNGPCPFDNVFGSFIAFMGLDAASFPSEFTHSICENDKMINNLRFIATSKFWWGGYVDDSYPVAKGKGGKRVDRFQMNGTDYWTNNGQFILRDLIRTPLPTTADGYLQRQKDYKGQGSLENYYRHEFHEMYKDLEDYRVECHYDDAKTLSSEDVLAYLDVLCKNGSQMKPEAMWISRDAWKKEQQAYWADYCKKHPGKCKKTKVKGTHIEAPKCGYGENQVQCEQ